MTAHPAAIFPRRLASAASQRIPLPKKPSLTVTHPELACQWHPTKNGEKWPEDFTAGSSAKDEHLELVAQLHPTKNEHLDLDKLTSGSRKKAVWAPEVAAQWHPTRNGDKRPDQDEHPELVAQLHPTKNEHLDLNKLTSGSTKKAVWVCHDRKNAPPGCTHAHEWSARIGDRTGNAKREGAGCPFCYGRVVCPCNSLAVKAPEVAAQWHPTRNGPYPSKYAALRHFL
ncbi:hypothetical protein COCSUDRAFT_59756 [Coccomyxa subellipsoidea C-169]|uniref:Treble clef zinc finger domain-containing protein n=1 Tax=Coccomyxa subellipsoidea (strain C-169) TaxID=574566 RepID=I0YKA6_COCSC|nr:hypothetical protein COCSUDRAFT_59756 [Coccomyxa subellipsoidea C-169]EIE18825.1 hypothetical protein COCSUDRAFT_59756 [Coccomyxa subellipsoidea C-169]|eukprot:XP_005643369.1 hypothetical protein COCSUDRAFT_59756 [Coccomyxa subellipsoidea C-169]